MDNKIDVIKAYREKTGLGLNEALHAINAYESGDTTNKTLIDECIKAVKERQVDESKWVRVTINITSADFTHEELRRFVLQHITLESKALKQGKKINISVN